MNTTSFLIPVHESILEVEALMRAQANGNHHDLKSALELLIAAGGKRIRPALTLLTGSMLNGDHDRLVTLAAAIELLHTATLVHDDLIDGSLLRRGTPTLNSQWSPGATVLTGDFIFARAAKLAAETNSVEVMKLFAETLSIIVNGEITQLFSSQCQSNRQEYYKRIYAKTASLFETSTTAAALISDVDSQTVEYVHQFGYEIGMAFQIIDDILDFTGEQGTIGKPVGSDLRQGLITLPTLCFIEANPGHPDTQFLHREKFFEDQARTVHLVEVIRSSGAIERAHQEASHFVERGLQSLRSLPDSPERGSLEELAEYIVDRDL